MIVHQLVALLACGALTAALPSPRDQVPPDPEHVDKVFADPALVDNCPGYAASNVQKSDSGLTADLKLAGSACNVFSDDLADLKLLVEYQTNERLHVKIYDAKEQVYQVQEKVLPRPGGTAAANEADLEFSLVEKPFSFSVKRKSNGEILFDTTGTNLVFETQYVRLRTRLPQNPNIYGLGEHSDPFRLPTQNYRRVLLNTESPSIPTNANLYGTHPVYFDHRGSKGTHGVFLLNSDPMVINLNISSAGDQYLEYNTIGGVIDLYFMAGSQPSQVSKQYADIVGYSAMFPYWTFGFHQCKYGYWDVNMVAEVVGNYSTANIPLEVMWTDIDHMHLREDFTVDPDRFPMKKMQELVQTLHSRDQKYVLILDPGIHAVTGNKPYDAGKEAGVFFKNADGTDYLGVQWPGVVAWPDWLNPATQDWWTDQFLNYYDPEEGIDIDGIWVDMNEASNFCEMENCPPDPIGNPPIPTTVPRPNTGRPIPGFPPSFQPTSSKARSIKARSLEARKANSVNVREDDASGDQWKGLPDRDYYYPKFNIGSHRGRISQFTINLNNTNIDGTRQYDTHNFYGHTMATTTQKSMLVRRPAKRPFVLTRSTFAGSGSKVTHWFGDNASTWEHYRASIRQMLAFVSMHQMPLVGSDVCGFNQNADQYMCARWALLGAFQPFYRNHAELSTIPQEFYQWPITIQAAQKAIDTRYKLMDYIYTALYYQTKNGVPMINPLFFLYPNDENTFGIQHQWFYGDALLISPVTTDYSDSVTYYLPNDIFYDYWTHAYIQGEGKNVTVSNVKYTDIPVHIRGGTIIPQRVNSANTTTLLRKEEFVFLIAPGEDGKAKGKLYLDDGESIEQPNASEITLNWDNGKFSTTGKFEYGGASGESVTVSKVVVMGQGSAAGMGTYNAAMHEIEVQGPWKLTGTWGFSL
ncbi:glycoside hydrolase family 31 protein [Amniculicola lignicola CBS 123094]|uniref:alpha-glucosidase n=1 Tax=Amniculicola lignicola CBS 123094 TaxID=1392246 RepID=A0A6A5WBK1_9PLEO|nr:glycoside hydrolase family 31 protein [Amniculicola lignicola CBS 123094]